MGVCTWVLYVAGIYKKGLSLLSLSWYLLFFSFLSFLVSANRFASLMRSPSVFTPDSCSCFLEMVRVLVGGSDLALLVSVFELCLAFFPSLCILDLRKYLISCFSPSSRSLLRLFCGRCPARFLTAASVRATGDLITIHNASHMAKDSPREQPSCE